RPSETRLGRRHQKFFLNRRFIRDRLIRSAMYRAYSSTIAHDRHPIVFLFLDVPTEQVDVNVHPTKVEVRFIQSQQIYGLVQTTIAAALSRTVGMERSRPDTEPGDPARSWTGNHQGHPSPATLPDDLVARGEAAIAERIRRALLSGEAGRDAARFPEYRPPYPREGGAAGAAGSMPASSGQLEMLPAAALPRIIGQLHSTFIVMEDNGDLLMVDQHTAHERVLFNHFSTLRAGEPPVAQRLLVPIDFQMDLRDAQILQEHIDGFTAFGFAIEHFGGRDFILTAVPALLKENDPVTMVKDMVDELGELQGTGGPRRLIDDMVSVMACKGAVKAHQRLSMEKMTALIEALYATGLPDTCPHGRPIIMRLPLKDIHAYFRR
ncbi:hypothetical protein JW905_01480, partial [bacterium]|nr:hypothetical protein [candidate division CSSED10-310 bacterium]